jgi:hypothetical protein
VTASSAAQACCVRERVAPSCFALVALLGGPPARGHAERGGRGGVSGGGGELGHACGEEAERESEPSDRDEALGQASVWLVRARTCVCARRTLESTPTLSAVAKCECVQWSMVAGSAGKLETTSRVALSIACAVWNKCGKVISVVAPLAHARSTARGEKNESRMIVDMPRLSNSGPAAAPPPRHRTPEHRSDRSRTVSDRRGPLRFFSRSAPVRTGPTPADGTPPEPPRRAGTTGRNSNSYTVHAARYTDRAVPAPRAPRSSARSSEQAPVVLQYSNDRTANVTVMMPRGATNLFLLSEAACRRVPTGTMR